MPPNSLPTPDAPGYTQAVSTTERNTTTCDSTRTSTFLDALREAHKIGMPAAYSNETPTDKLITLTDFIRIAYHLTES